MSTAPKGAGAKRAGDKRTADESEVDATVVAGGAEDADPSLADVGGLIASMNRIFDFQREEELASSDTDSELDDYGSSCGDSDGGCGVVGTGAGGRVADEGLDQMIADRQQRALRQQMQDMRRRQQEQPPPVPPKPMPRKSLQKAQAQAQAGPSASACSAPQSSAQLASGEDLDL